LLAPGALVVNEAWRLEAGLDFAGDDQARDFLRAGVLN